MHNKLLKVFLSSHSANPKSKIHNRKLVGIILIVVALTMCGARADAQQPGKVFRIGYLDVSTASVSAFLLDALRQELSKLGWVEGKISPSSIVLPSKRKSACMS